MTKQKLGILTPGLGAVSSTLMAGVAAARRGLGTPVGSLTQLGQVSREGVSMRWSDLLPLAGLDDVVFGAWDPFSENAYEVARAAGVLPDRMLEPLRGDLEAVRPMSAVFDSDWVRNLHETPNCKESANKWEAAEALQEDIRNFRAAHQLDRLVMVWCASTETYRGLGAMHDTVRSFEEGLKQNDPLISPTQIYAYAALKERVPFANGAPNIALDAPALGELAMEMGVPVCGKDFKTGQTLMKTVLAPALKKRLLGIRGWFSTNILGNRDGLVLDDPDSFKSKELTKTGVLDQMLEPEKYPELYGDLYHKVRINYYPPRGDDKEGWDNIDIFGWMGQSMQIKIDFQCKDSILAAPLVLDLALLLDLAQQKQQRGTQDWLGYYFKNPMGDGENDLFEQYDRLESALIEFATR